MRFTSGWRVGTCIAVCLFYTGLSQGEACEVRTKPANGQIPVVQGHTCYAFEGMPQGSIDWSCSNEDKGRAQTEKSKVRECPKNAVASCRATLTQETLANERSTHKEAGQATPGIPADAKVITWYYDITDQTQAGIDCRQAGGSFRYPLK